jgi:hypothetical protein
VSFVDAVVDSSRIILIAEISMTGRCKFASATTARSGGGWEVFRQL